MKRIAALNNQTSANRASRIKQKESSESYWIISTSYPATPQTPLVAHRRQVKLKQLQFLERQSVCNIVLTPQTPLAGHPFKFSLFAIICASSFIKKKQPTVSCFKNNRQNYTVPLGLTCIVQYFAFTYIKYILW